MPRHDPGMHDQRSLKLLDFVERRLDAEQCRIEIGGRLYDDPCWVGVPLGEHRRMVVVFTEPPDDADSVRERLQAYVTAFEETATVASQDIAPAVPGHGPKEALDAELAAFAASAGAQGAAIVDGSSPVVWGRSHEEIGEEVEALLGLVEPGEAGEARRGAMTLAEAPRARLLAVAEAVRRAREAVDEAPQELGTIHQTQGLGTDAPTGAYGVAGGYLLVVAFEDLSETRVERALRQYRERIERLIGRLPPVDPPPRGGKVVRLSRS